jgi:hypothetical protein
MAEELKGGCARPTGGPAGDAKAAQNDDELQITEEKANMIMVGKPAPDFTAPGYQNGKFINVKLSDYLGKWTLLCFYPGDFTFV